MMEYQSPEEALRATGATQQRFVPKVLNGGQGARRFIRTNTNAIMAKVFEPIRWIVPDYVPEGLSILAGRQKLGKTWMALDWAIAVACGGYAMGSIPCEEGDALYLDLENGERRIQRRVETLFPHERNRPDLARLEWMQEAPMLNAGLLDEMDDWRRSVQHPRLVCIDVFQRIKPAGNANQNSYESDYSVTAPLQQWATTHGIGVVALHHTKKGGADDPLEALSGSNGLSACADTTLVLDRDGNGTTLYVRGRDVEEKETALKFAAGMWTVMGDAADVRRSDQRTVILTFLRNNAQPITPADLATELGWKSNNTRQLLFQMARKGEVLKEKGGYVLPPPNSHNADNTAEEEDHE